ncbi:MAG: DNA topoisomerase IV subunit B, partial [Candidatus Atribacteria bacterium]|nr:DNA topoisomerase IV subunit B [Candidatus Atribacteria bacterium]
NDYFFSEEAMQQKIKELKVTYGIQRYKGLGEMNPSQLWETTMNPETRVLKRVELEDALEADEMFTILMGDKVEPRKEFIYLHSAEVKELDI